MKGIGAEAGHQPSFAGRVNTYHVDEFWRATIRIQRRSIERRLDRTPSLRTSVTDADWLGEAWDDALAQAAKETGLASFPDACPWSAGQILDPEFLPE